jgi:hypothetical protein
MPRGPETSRTDATTAQRHTGPRRRNPVVWLIVCGCVLISAIVMGTIMMTDGFRQRALTNAKRELENTVLLLARHFEQQFEDAETAAKDVVIRLRVSTISSPDAFRTQMSSAAVTELLRSVVGGLSYIGDLNIIDSEGRIINSTAQGSLANIDWRDVPISRR